MNTTFQNPEISPRFYKIYEIIEKETVRKIKDGTYVAEGFLDNDGITNEPIKMKMTVNISGEKVNIDLKGSSSQMTGPVNCGFAQTVSACRVAFKNIVNPKRPVDGGTFKTLTLDAPDGSIFRFLVAGPKTEVLDIDTDLSQLPPAQWFGNNREARFEMVLPTRWDIEMTRVIVSMPGIVLVDEGVPTKAVTETGDTMTWNLNAQDMNYLANNFDYERGIADTVDVTFYVQGTFGSESVQAYGTITVHGSRIAKKPVFENNVRVKSDVDSTKMLADLPDIMSFITNKTDQFLVDMDYVKGGHPFKGQGSKDPDDGAHVNFDNSSNQWPKGTPITEFPPIYAVADGYVERIDAYEPVGENNFKYGNPKAVRSGILEDERDHR